MPRVLFQLTGFQRDLLYVIAGQDRPSGQQIKKELEGELGDITHGRLYPNLDTLVKNDLIKKGTHDRRTNYYEITERGLAELERRRKWEDQYVNL